MKIHATRKNGLRMLAEVVKNKSAEICSKWEAIRAVIALMEAYPCSIRISELKAEWNITPNDIEERMKLMSSPLEQRKMVLMRPKPMDEVHLLVTWPGDEGDQRIRAIIDHIECEEQEFAVLFIRGASESSTSDKGFVYIPIDRLQPVWYDEEKRISIWLVELVAQMEKEKTGHSERPKKMDHIHLSSSDGRSDIHAIVDDITEECVVATVIKDDRADGERLLLDLDAHTFVWDEQTAVWRVERLTERAVQPSSTLIH